MPELPEVQTIISDLNKKIVGDTITDFWSNWPKTIKGKSLAIFKKEIIDRKIIGIRRIGKNIFIDLSGGKTLYIHLKMTGHLLVKSAKLKVKSGKKDYFQDKVNQYIHHVWYLKSHNPKPETHSLNYDKTIEFSDVRKFAKIVLDDTQKIKELKEIKALGIDALDKKFTLERFEDILEKRKNTPIGIILMEQERISGIGNIYRSEILFEAGILPERLVKDIKGPGIKKLYSAIQKVLKKAIKLRGTSDSDYRDTAGAPGNFQKALKVYKKNGKKCRAYRTAALKRGEQPGQKCDTIIIRGKLGQRSVFFCPACQK
ncbi:MAG: bifunctional DNA-formamidopyrimidine glycosylase/DNA-(apurinic or apyrimidinic site) lyase [Candidatus Moranbacteria bacterium CG_4_9_14_3_um_filter_42_9]|nr:MAG: bifunctional DNA-formamidopyrimidine glycosylase/DNA-(apurinic or apyrimidinic site) lyase [Candidatus Moranbacteria bacterium CG_4_9_14_3_um_filter_42_9]